jgi:hypothetical protein
MAKPVILNDEEAAATEEVKNLFNLDQHPLNAITHLPVERISLIWFTLRAGSSFGNTENTHCLRMTRP